jgi:hypothetical protein
MRAPANDLLARPAQWRTARLARPAAGPAVLWPGPGRTQRPAAAAGHPHQGPSRSCSAVTLPARAWGPLFEARLTVTRARANRPPGG